jgi:DNA-binding NarL/FixJ family response regulator
VVQHYSSMRFSRDGRFLRRATGALYANATAQIDFRGAAAVLMCEEFTVPARILIADDHDVVRQGIRSIIAKSRPEWEICGEATNGQEAVDTAKMLSPDVIILDITMPLLNGIEAASRIAAFGLRCRILVFTMHESERLCADIREVGAHGYVQKSHAGRDLIGAIDALLAGGTFFGVAVNPVA